MNIQWLLVGGPYDGQTVWIKQGGRVTDGNVCYQGKNYLEGGRLYRVGFVHENDFSPSKVRELIHRTGVRHFAGS